MVISALVGLACGSSKSKVEEPPLTLKEIGRQEIGPGGGTVTGGPVTIEIPEGALSAPRTIIINETDANARQLPADTQIAGGLYVLQPDDITFLKPVTVKIQVDGAKKRADGQGAIVLFRGTAANTTWQPYGADETSATVITGKTTHFSLWVPTAAADAYCYRQQCNGFARFGPNGEPVGRDGRPLDPNFDAGVRKQDQTLETFTPGLDCTVPTGATEKGVVCTGAGERNGPPYSCRCIGSDAVLGTWDRVPADTTVSALAQQCGAPACPPRAQFTCNIGWQCSGNDCYSEREPRLLCNGSGGGAAPPVGSSDGGVITPPPAPTGGGWACSCAGTGKTFPIPGPTATNDDIVPLWQANCGGSCEGASGDPNDEWVCPGNIAGDIPGGGCFTEAGGVCRDEHTYRAECDKGGAEIATCKCMVDGKVTKEVQGLCVEGHFICSWPRMRGAADTRKCPRTVDGPIVKPVGGMPPDGPMGCRAITGGPCLDGHTYSVECPKANDPTAPPGPTECSCLVDGKETKKVTISRCYDEGPTACGWPQNPPQ